MSAMLQHLQYGHIGTQKGFCRRRCWLNAVVSFAVLLLIAAGCLLWFEYSIYRAVLLPFLSNCSYTILMFRYSSCFCTYQSLVCWLE